jgi:hypothetical protein
LRSIVVFSVSGECSAKALMMPPPVLLTGHGLDTIEPTKKAEDDWMVLVFKLAQRSLLSRAKTWYVGTNIKDKAQGLSLFTGGFPKYREHCTAAIQAEYRDFVFERGRTPVAA